MYLSKRASFVRNVVVASVNGGITLILLLIAPLGLAAVIVNTLLVGLSTLAVCSLSDGIIVWLLLKPSLRRSLHQSGNLASGKEVRGIEKRKNRDLDENQP